MGARVLAVFQVAEAGDGYISGKMSENISYFSFLKYSAILLLGVHFLLMGVLGEFLNRRPLQEL